jgi:hypothetical protein
MAKRVFFSFHYEDVIALRANVVRNHWLTKPDRTDAGYFDASVWESVKKQGEQALRQLINGALKGTSNTCVLIGSHTYLRPWVRYELLKSFQRGNHLFGVHINGIKGKDGSTKTLGVNPFAKLGVTYSGDGQTATLWEFVDGEWRRYTKSDGSASYSVNVTSQYRNNGFALSQWYPVYRWNADDGYSAFASWVR